ncbi:MAG: 6-carboxytetrahydropterin synthase [Armatimonadetes bacterium]|nr:6-carboxytetrahydropterin synthase [Armatimonadota bacterium]
MSLVSLSRRVTFSSGHRYWRADLSAEENRALYGEWASPFNHGHNYVLWVTARGVVDPENGMVVNIKWIDDVLQEKVVQTFNQKSINDEIPWFFDKSSSLENLLAYFRHELQNLPGNVELSQLKLEETETLYAEWHTENNMTTLTRIYELAASHRLHVPELSGEENVRLFGKCNRENGHGHNYVLEVTVTGAINAETGMMVDIGALDEAVERLVVDRYDHHNLDMDIPELAGKNTTSEVVAQAIFDLLQGNIPGDLVRVRLFETARNMFEVTA